MMLWFFGAFVVSSVFMIGSYALMGWRHRRPPSVYNAALMLGLSVDLLATSMAWTSGVRLLDLYAGTDLASGNPVPLFGGYVVLLIAKVGLVWVAALREGRTYSKRIWWGFWAAMAAWSVVAGVVG